MNDLTDKAKIVYGAFEMLGATDADNMVTAYTILDFISEEEDLQNYKCIANMEEQVFLDIIMELSIKGVNAIIASLCRKGIVEKTEPSLVVIDGEKRYLRKYYIKNTLL